MAAFYRVSFFCHGCGLENTFTYHCVENVFEAMQKAASFNCPSGCNSHFEAFELTSLHEVAWQAAIAADAAVFH
ncbi:hypothetical protein MYX64_09525 [Nitrospinae bacterium AH_259_B05_G02_I21]|nr:hypothetical protein [Nitrospinae bacterium AH_259_B05_G02_I21]